MTSGSAPKTKRREIVEAPEPFSRKMREKSVISLPMKERARAIEIARIFPQFVVVAVVVADSSIKCATRSLQDLIRANVKSPLTVAAEIVTEPALWKLATGGASNEISSTILSMTV